MPPAKHLGRGDPREHPYERLVGDLLMSVPGVLMSSTKKVPRAEQEGSSVPQEPLLQDRRDADPSVRTPSGKCMRCQNHRDRITTHHPVQSLLADVTAKEMKMLIKILRVDINEWNATADNRSLVKQMIQDSPRGKIHRTRASYLITVLDHLGQKIASCGWHKNLNSALLNEIFDLVKVEVTSNLDVLREYPSVVGTKETEIVRALEVVKGMWTKPWPPSSVLPGSWDYQANRCRACMLSRIVLDPDILELFRAALLSRTRTKRKHRAPRLLKFIDACIAAQPTQSGKIWYDGADKAVGLKEARKRAVKLMHRETHANGHAHAHRRHRHHRNHPAQAHPEPGKRDPAHSQSLLDTCPDSTDSVKPSTVQDQEEIAKFFASLKVSEKLHQMDKHNTSASTNTTNTTNTIITPTTRSPSTPIDLSISHFRDSELEYGSEYVPPRSSPSWRSLLHSFHTEPEVDVQIPDPLRWNKVIGETPPHMPPNRVEETPGDSDRFADSYRELVIGYNDKDDESDSHYSQVSEWEYVPIRDGGPAETTWDLMMVKANEAG